MIKARRSGAVKRARIPAWIKDKANQRKWNDKFIGILRRDYVNVDLTIPAILRNELLARLCATKINTYADKD